MKAPFFLLALLAVNAASAQTLATVGRRNFIEGPGRYRPLVGPPPADNSAYLQVKDANPFFDEEWENATLIARDRTVFEDIAVKLDLMENKVRYLDSSKTELIVGIPIDQISYTSKLTAKPVHLINGYILPERKAGWYQLLVNDTLTLLKSTRKLLDYHTSYGSPPEYSIKTLETYFVLYEYREYPVKKPSDFIKILPNKKKEIEAYIKTTDSLNKDEELTAVATYCNTILK